MKQYFFFWNFCICALLLCLSLSCGEVFAGDDAQPGKCEITSGGKIYKPSDCMIRKETDDGLHWYNIERKNGKPLLEEILSVSIVEMDKDTAEVSGVTQDGINSRWGKAKRDGTCWSGEDFRICIE
ncbi:hypothetical protein [Desulfovibrio sp. SGI.169]|uniref:hypothetical protein n=1 Tax=Desulfovibrio sp. SGI.169 TaxID=3420561 RepID=UPI003D039830